MAKLRSALVGFWLDHPAIDALIGLGVLGALALTNRRWDVDVLATMPASDRMGLYTDLITISGIFLAFSATGLAAYLALSGGNAEKLRRLAHKEILQQWVSCIAGTSLVLALFVTVKIGDRSDSATWAHALAAVAVVFLCTKAARMVYVLARLAGVLTAPVQRRRQSDKAPRLKKVG